MSPVIFGGSERQRILRHWTHFKPKRSLTFVFCDKGTFTTVKSKWSNKKNQKDRNAKILRHG